MKKCFSHCKSKGSSVFSKLTSGSSYQGIMRLDISSSLSMISFSSIRIILGHLAPFSEKKGLIVFQKSLLSVSFFYQGCYNSPIQLFLLIISKLLFARLRQFSNFLFLKNLFLNLVSSIIAFEIALLMVGSLLTLQYIFLWDHKYQVLFCKYLNNSLKTLIHGTTVYAGTQQK